MKQKTIRIINIDKTTQKGKVESDIYIRIWTKNEEKLRLGGWIPKDEIDSISFKEAVDPKRNSNVEIIEATEVDSYDLLNLDELKELCVKNEIKFHHAAKEKKLISLLRGE